MKYCKYCGKQIEEDTEICPFCKRIVSAHNKPATISSRKYCKHCGKQIEQYEEICPFCKKTVSSHNKSTVKSSKNVKNAGKKASIGLIILSAIAPIVGIVLGFTKMGTETEAANKYLLAATIGLCLGLITIFF